MLNQVQLIGNLGADPEIRSTNGGNQVANMRIATSERWKDRDGNKQERTEWHNVVVWGPLADVVGRYLKKGSKVFVSGKLQTRKWQDQSGNDRYTTEVVLQGPRAAMEMLDSKPSGQQDQSGYGRDDFGGGGGGFNGGSSRRPQQSFDTDLDDDVPF